LMRLIPDGHFASERSISHPSHRACAKQRASGTLFSLS
jgi:hypothetical protein